MGNSDRFVKNFYDTKIIPKGDVALLGYSNNSWYQGDLYDLSLENWNINSDWKLNKKYDTIICTRVAYFAQEPKELFRKCAENLKPGGKLFIDWGLGDHWRFEPYKVGWVDSEGVQEYAYQEDNKLWSTVWSDDFICDGACRLFTKRIKKFGYESLKAAVFKEVPKVLDLDEVKQYFTKVKHYSFCLWEDNPQLYILLECEV